VTTLGEFETPVDVNALKRRVAAAVEAQLRERLGDVYERVLALRARADAENRNVPISSSATRAIITCWSCDEEGHATARCPQRESNGPLKYATCWRCGSTGHLRAWCPRRRRESAAHMTCWRCREVGHRAARCTRGCRSKGKDQHKEQPVQATEKSPRAVASGARLDEEQGRCKVLSSQAVFVVGDPVWLLYPTHQADQQGQPSYRGGGPYVVKKIVSPATYRVQREEGRGPDRGRVVVRGELLARRQGVTSVEEPAKPQRSTAAGAEEAAAATPERQQGAAGETVSSPPAAVAATNAVVTSDTREAEQAHSRVAIGETRPPAVAPLAAQHLGSGRSRGHNVTAQPGGRRDHHSSHRRPLRPARGQRGSREGTSHRAMRGGPVNVHEVVHSSTRREAV
jgi:hypothetical protein